VLSNQHLDMFLDSAKDGSIWLTSSDSMISDVPVSTYFCSNNQKSIQVSLVALMIFQHYHILFGLRATRTAPYRTIRITAARNRHCEKLTSCSMPF